MTPRGRRIAIIVGVVVFGVGVATWALALRGPDLTPRAETSGASWRLVSQRSTIERAGLLTSDAEAGGLHVQLVTTGAPSSCQAPSIRGVDRRGGRVVVRMQWASRTCTDAARGESFELVFTGPPPSVITFDEIESCARWDVTSTVPQRLDPPDPDGQGDCPI